MSARDAQIKNNWTSVHMFSEDHFTPQVQEQKWDLIRITCMQPFLNDVQFGLSFFKVFCFPEKEPPLPRPQTPPRPGSAFAKMREHLAGKVCLVAPANRSEQLLLAVKEKEGPFVKKLRKNKSEDNSRRFYPGTNNLIATKEDSSQNSLEDVPTTTSSPHFNSTEYNSFTPSRKSFSSQDKEKKSITSPMGQKRTRNFRSSSSSKVSLIDLSHEEIVSSQQCIEMDKKSSRSKLLSSSGNNRHGVNIINISESESESETSTVLLPPLTPRGKSREHSSISALSPCRLQRDFDSLSEAETVILDVTPKKTGKSMKLQETNTEEVLFIQDTRSDCDEPKNIIVLEHKELPGPSRVSCPLCSELFDVLAIEQHAATCNSSPEPTLICPVCSKYFPLEILEQHADLCVEITLNDQ